MLLDHAVQFSQCPCEGGRLVQQHPAHAQPLGAVAGIDEGGFAGIGQGFSGDYAWGGFAPCIGRQTFRNLRAVAAEYRQTLFQPLPAISGGMGQVVQAGRIFVAQTSGILVRQIAQGLRCACGKNQGRRRKRFPAAGLCRAGAMLLQYHVRVGAAEAKGVHPHEQATFAGRKFATGGDDFQIEAGKIDVRVGGFDMDGRRQTAVLQRQHGLDQSGHAGGRLKMPQIALDRTHRQWRTGCARLADDVADGCGFDRVAYSRAGSMSFHVIEVGRGNAGLAHDLAQQIGLAFDTGDGDTALAPAIGIGAAGQNDRLDVIAIRFGLGERFQHQDGAALRADITVARSIKGLAASVGRKHRGLGETDEGIGMQQQVDAADQRQRRLAIAQAPAGLVQCDQGGRTGGVHRHAWAMQIEHIGQAVGGDAERIAGHGIGIHAAHVVQRAHAVIEPGNADIDRAIGAGKRGWRDAAIFHGLPGKFEQQALLGIQSRGFARRDAEECSVKLVQS